MLKQHEVEFDTSPGSRRSKTSSNESQNPYVRGTKTSSNGSPRSSNGEYYNEQAAAGLTADHIAANGMRERCVSSHDTKRTKRSASKCLRAASVDGNDPSEVRRRQQIILDQQLQLRKQMQPPWAVDPSVKRFESHQGRLLSDGCGYKSGSATARGPREPSPGSSMFLRNLDLTYGGASWDGPGSRCRTPKATSIPDRELQKVCDLVSEKVERRFQNPRECMKCVNTQKDGFVTGSEVQAFFRAFNIPDETADRIFERLDSDGSGLIEYEKFKDFVETRIKPNKSREVTPCSTRASSATTSRRSSPTPYDEIDYVSMNTKGLKTLSRGEMQRKLSQAVQLIAEKANLRYPSFRELRQAFRWVDLSKDGKVTRAEVENFFRVFAVPIETTEYVFVLLDAEGSSEINHSDFVDIFGPAMGIGHREPSHKKQLELPGNRDLEREVNEIMRIMEDHMLKFSHPREAMRSLDLSHDGRVTRDEVRTFFLRFGIEHEHADHVFNYLRNKDAANDNLETCSYADFMNLFDPVMQPSHYAPDGVVGDFTSQIRR